MGWKNNRNVSIKRTQMTLAEQAEIFLERLKTRKRSPIKPATIAAYNSYLKNWILPELGSLDLSLVENGVMKKFVAKLAEKQLSAASISGITNCVKGIVGSAVDENGNELYARKWNSEFIDAPILNSKDQKAPIISAEAVSSVLSSAEGIYRPLFALLAGTGLRISESLALRRGPIDTSSYWDSDKAVLVIRKALWRGKEQGTKTPSGVREVDITKELNDYLKESLKDRGIGAYIFGHNGERPFRLRTLYDEAARIGIPGYHSFRRFRITHLENMGVPRGMVMYWTGHAAGNVHETYIKLDKDIQARRDWCEKAGLGFKLP